MITQLKRPGDDETTQQHETDQSILPRSETNTNTCILPDSGRPLLIRLAAIIRSHCGAVGGPTAGQWGGPSASGPPLIEAAFRWCSYLYYASRVLRTSVPPAAAPIQSQTHASARACVHVEVCE